MQEFRNEHTSFQSLGNKIAAECGHPVKFEQALKSLFVDNNAKYALVSLMSAAVTHLKELREEIRRLPSQMANAQVSAEMALEREKQKTEQAYFREEVAAIQARCHAEVELEKEKQRTVRSQLSAEMVLEKEKQKTEQAMEKRAMAQQKAVEAMTPPTVTVIQMTPEEIVAAVDNGRVLRRF